MHRFMAQVQSVQAINMSGKNKVAYNLQYEPRKQGSKFLLYP